jgi:hypothetical protein
VSHGTRFHPGGFPALFGVPADELVDLRVPISDVAQRFRSLERLAADALAPDPLVRAVLTPRTYAWSHASPDTASVSFVAGSGPPPAMARSG